VIHEYFDYRTWSFAERAPLHDEFVQTVMRSWRNNGGEPDIGRPLMAWLEESGFRIESLRPFIDVITPRDSMFAWPKAFMESGTRRLVDIGELTRSAPRRCATSSTREPPRRTRAWSSPRCWRSWPGGTEFRIPPAHARSSDRSFRPSQRLE